MIILSTLLISMFTTIILIPIFTGLATKLKAMDFPNERKVHQIPTPKSGGISMTLGALVPVLLWVPINEFTQSLLIGAWIVVFFGLIDDFKELDYKIKFGGQLSAALIVVLYGGLKIKTLGGILPFGNELPNIVSVPMTIIVIVGVTNAINLSDGLDGLAGGICTLSFLCLGYLAFVHTNRPVFVISVAMIGSIVGFLRYNTYPASVFMGDAGSQLLGFLLVSLSLTLTQQSNQLSPILPLVIIGLPVIDTLVVMMERIAQGGSPFQADKKHLHHKFIRLGFFHSESVLIIYSIQAFLLTMGFILRDQSDLLLLFLYLLYSSGIIFMLWFAEWRGWKRTKNQYVIDKILKGRLKRIKDKQLAITISFKISLVGVPILFVVACFLPSQYPTYLSVFSLALLCIIFFFRIFMHRWEPNSLKFSLYLLIPFIIFLGEKNTADWMNVLFLKVYNYSYVLVVSFIILTLRFTRRKGFTVTPMDFLILFVALIIPNLPDEQIKHYQMGWIASKIIALYFSFEVLNGELRANLGQLAIPIICAMGVISFRGFLGV